MKKRFYALPLVAFFPKIALAHCPLCTIGAGALAVFAASIGVSSVVVGVLIGAFALALGLWIPKTIHRQYVPYQEEILVALITLGTIIPIMPLVVEYGPLYLPFIGSYGTTFTINLFILGAIIGILIMYVAPFVSREVTAMRKQQAPFQGVGITILLLIVISIIVQLVS